MGLLSLEHSKAAYRADLALHGAAVAGLAGWTAIEYAMHRFVLHGMPPFRAWHALHHARPSARIGAPTLLSGSLIVGALPRTSP